MKLHPVRVERRGGVQRISCEVHSGTTVETWWIDVPDRFGWLQAGAAGVEPFVPLAGLLAGVLGEDLEVVDPVDSQLLDGVDRAAALFEDWWGWRRPAVRARRVSGAAIPAGRRAAMFSRGVDSSAEVATALLGEAPAIDVLVTISGNDVHWSPRVERDERRRTSAVARELGLPLVELRTNLRAFADRHVSWDDAHGAVVTGAAHTLASGCGHVVVSQPISAAMESASRRSHGLTRTLSAYWSSGRVTIDEATGDLSRPQKVAQVLRVPALANAISVCWEADQVGNCGRCRKCLTTSTALLALDRADLVERLFDAPVDPGRIRRIEPIDTFVREIVLEVVDGLRAAVDAGTTTQASDAVDLVEVLDAWDELMSAGSDHAPAGLAGLDVVTRLRTAGPDRHGPVVTPQVGIGWGVGATPIHASIAERQSLLTRSVPSGRPIDWCLVEHRSPLAAEVAAELSELRPGGAVLLVEAGRPTAPPAAVRRLLVASNVRCWSSDAAHLEGVPLLESLAAGCVPVQVATDAVTVRSVLPPWAHVLVRGLEEMGEFLDSPELRSQAFRAATALAVGGSLERDAHLLHGAPR